MAFIKISYTGQTTIRKTLLTVNMKPAASILALPVLAVLAITGPDGFLF
jgi:hypothetical protein